MKTEFFAYFHIAGDTHTQKTEFTAFIIKKGQESLTQKLEPSSKSAQIFMRAHAYNRLLRARF